MSWFRRLLSQFDPTRKGSVVSGALRQLDPTNRNSLVGKVAPYAVGAIPGIGLPVAMGIGAGLRASQAVGRGEDLGEIAGSALRGAGEAGLTRGVARAVMPGTFAPGGAPLNIGRIATAPGTDVMAGLTPATTNLASAASASAMPAGNVAAIGSRVLTAGGGDGIKPGGNFLRGIGSYLTNPKNLPVVTAGLGAAADIYGAHELGQAEDVRNEIAQRAAATAEEEAQRRLNRVPFDEWKRRRDAARIGGTPTPV